jgi:biopolymer transport protein ExbB
MLLTQGGPVLLLLGLLSLAALTLIIIKVWSFAEARMTDARTPAQALAHVHAGRADAALAALAARPSPQGEVLSAAIRGLQAGDEVALVRERAVLDASERIDQARHLFRPLELIAATAPLLGLLGTVLGMIEAFRRLEAAGDRVDPSILSGGIWEALLTTAAGLIVALPVIAVLAWLESRVARLHRLMESALTRLFTGTGPGA